MHNQDTFFVAGTVSITTSYSSRQYAIMNTRIAYLYAYLGQSCKYQGVREANTTTYQHQVCIQINPVSPERATLKALEAVSLLGDRTPV